jgi:hypothetical protein
VFDSESEFNWDIVWKEDKNNNEIHSKGQVNAFWVWFIIFCLPFRKIQ